MPIAAIRRLVSCAADAARSPLTSSPLTPGEVVLSAALLAALALTIYLPHIVNGGWYVDDWILIARMHEAGGVVDAFRALNVETFRPGLALTLSLLHQVGGTGHAGYLTIGALLAATQGWLFYLVLRTLRITVAVAAVVAATFVVLPVIDATRLWISAFPTQVAGVLYLLGLLVALRGVAHAGRRRAVTLHCAAAVLYLAAVLTYELIAGLIVVSAILYRVRSGWGPALRRWPVDLAAIALALAVMIPRGATEREANTSLAFLWDRITGTLTQAEAVFGWLLPFHGVLGGGPGRVLLLIGTLGAGIAIGRGDRWGRGLAAWAKAAALATVFALAGLAMLLPADPYFVPRISGMGNRTGAFAAFGATMLLVALIVLTLGGLGSLLRRPRLGFALAVAMVIATSVNLAAREFRQQGPWAESWRLQQETLVAIDDALGGRLPPRAALVSFGHTTFILPADVSVFAYQWDLRGALWETYSRPNVQARPWEPAATCNATGLVFPDETEIPERERNFRYGRPLIFADVASIRAATISSQATCEATVAALTGQAPS